MNLKHLFSRQTINNISRFNGRILSPCPHVCKNVSTITTPISAYVHSSNNQDSTFIRSPKYEKPNMSFNKCIHSDQKLKLSDTGTDPSGLGSEESEEDENLNEFLSRFVWIMRGKLSEVYPECDKETIDGMLLIIVGKVVSEIEKDGLEQMLGTVIATPSHDFSQDLWRTVWEVSNEVLDDMQKAKKKEKMKGFLQSEDVKVMSRFAGEVGIRGELLRELRFKWAREKMEESEFYESLELLRKDEAQFQEEDEAMHKKSETMGEEVVETNFVTNEVTPKVISIPKRRGKIRYKIYGLDLSDPKWAEVADKIHETGEIIWLQEPKPTSGKCKLVTERILSLKEEDDLLHCWLNG